MKKSRTIISFMILLAAFACTKNTAEESGQVTFSLSGDYEIADKTKSNVSQFTSLPSSDDFEVSIRNSSSSDVWSGKISEWASNTQLQAGNYSVTATYGSLEEEGFEVVIDGVAFVHGEQDAKFTKNMNIYEKDSSYFRWLRYQGRF